MWNYWLGGKGQLRRRPGRGRTGAPGDALDADDRPGGAAVPGRRGAPACGRARHPAVPGLPTADNTHDVAQQVASESRIVYVDHDPVVLSHAQAVLTSSPEGKTDYIQADLRDTDTILAGAARTLDFSRPVAVLLIAVLHFILDPDDPYRIVARLMDAVPSGSYLVMAHAASDISPERPRRWPGSTTGCPRCRSPRGAASRSPGSSTAWT